VSDGVADTSGGSGFMSSTWAQPYTGSTIYLDGGRADLQDSRHFSTTPMAQEITVTSDGRQRHSMEAPPGDQRAGHPQLRLSFCPRDSRLSIYLAFLRSVS